MAKLLNLLNLRSILRLSESQSDQKSVSQLSTDSGVPKSTPHRHKTKQAERIAGIGHDFFETDTALSRRTHFFVG